LQCGDACHDKLYYDEEIIKEMVEKTEDCRIPTDLIPKCPVCGEEMETNLRKDNLFVQDKNWYDANKRYSNFLSKIQDNKVVFLELGVGFNTPSIIKYPFEQWTYDNENATLIRINRDYPDAIKENVSKTVSFDEDMDEIFEYWLSRIF
jgi:NAD-dependent SIR2 family protein deacetylase